MPSNLKLSQLPTGSAPALTDYLVAILGGSPVDSKLKISDFLTGVFSNQIQSYSNSGSAGGTFYYLSLGGFKLLWGTSTVQTIGGSGPVSVALHLNFPTSPSNFFSSIQAIMGSAVTQSVGNFSTIGFQSTSATGTDISFNNISGTALQFAAGVLVIGS